MPLNRALPPEIDQALARGWLVLTANQRAARTLRHAYDLHQRVLGRTVWEPPPILAWDTWTHTLWNRLLLDGHATKLLLSPAQEHTLWRAIIAADAATASLRPIDALAETAAGAWKLLHDYRGRSRLQSFPGNADTRAFARWVAEFERRCASAQYFTQPQLPETLRAALAANRLTSPSGILLVGFDSQTPGQTVLLDALRSTGAPIEEQSPGAPSKAALPPWVGDTTSSRTLVAAPDQYTELNACARWLRAHLTALPDATIAVIVPAIDSDRAEIDRAFRQILAPELNDFAAPTASGPYEFSLGVPLAHTPLAATALDILRWAAGALPLDRVCGLLLSPYFAADQTGPAEHIARAEFDAFTLRQQPLLQPEITLDAFYELVSGSKQTSSLPLLREHLRALRAAFRRRELAREGPYAAWATTFHELLEAAGWAPLAHLDSIEFQTRTKWEDALDELATLDFDSRADGTRVSFHAALAALERIAAETLFAPESRHAPIQIMGPLESAGSAFDAIWFLRANDLAWPATSAPNPLLPWLLQRELAMPGANAILDTARARRITERIAVSAPTVLFSYAYANADGPQRRSPMLDSLPLEPRKASALAPPDDFPPCIELETLDDTDPLPPPPDSTLRGGASILQAQAACGFRAFAEKRLFSSAPDTIELGLDASERGSLVHRSLELFWTGTRTQAALRAMPRADRDRLLTRSIETALKEKHQLVDPGWPRAYVTTERKRLFQLLDAWLDLELTRPAFAVKAMEEKLRNALIGPLHLDVRVDRVDTSLVDGEPAGDIILDYKTGTVSPAKWLGERPDEPQLPLYTVLSQPFPIAAVAFANVRLGEDQPLKGYESRKGVLPSASKLKTDSLDAQIDSWRKVLTALAEDFHHGDARVAPKQYPSTCRYCKQRLLCRLDLVTLEADANEDFVDSSDPTVDSLEPPAEAERG
jgi:probable DNA repair protein